MSTETTNKKIKIDNGTTFGRAYTDKAIDELLKNVGGGLPIIEPTNYKKDTTNNIFSATGDLPSNEATQNELNMDARGLLQNYALLYKSGNFQRLPLFHDVPGNFTYTSNIQHNNDFSKYWIYYIALDDDTEKVYIKYKELNFGKTISLFGKHSILVPTDSTDNNIDLFNHSITSNNGSNMLLIQEYSSSNLAVDSATDLNTLLRSTARKISANGVYDGSPIIMLDWQGSYATSKVLTVASPSGVALSRFTAFADVVTTI